MENKGILFSLDAFKGGPLPQNRETRAAVGNRGLQLRQLSQPPRQRKGDGDVLRQGRGAS